MSKLEGSLAQLETEKIKEQMKGEDAQSGKKSSVPSVSSDMWLLVRSINARRCADEVMLQVTNFFLKLI